MVNEPESHEHLDPAGMPMPIDSTLAELVFSLIARVSTCRFAAVYPVSFQTVAVNDGLHVNVCVADDLHERLRTLLSAAGNSPVQWLVCDTISRTYQICDVTQAHEVFVKNKW